MAIISAPRLLVEQRLTGPGAIVVEGDRIVDVLDTVPAPASDHVALKTGLLTPGLIDVQINGCFGVDFASAGPDEWRAVCAALPAYGVTAFQPTFITNPIDALVASLTRFAAARDELAGGSAGARPLGAHVEGPFISPERAGAHDRAFMLQPTQEHLDALLADPVARGAITTVTLAPELPGAIEAIRRLAGLGILVSVGHSNATGQQVHAAVQAGARMVTHIFNAQRPLGHREPGVAGQALAEPALTIGLVGDLFHVAAPICAMVLNAAAGRVALVTDALAAAGMPPGRYEVGGEHIVVKPGDPVARRADGTISGSTVFLDSTVRNMIEAGVDPARVFDAATRVPADTLGRHDLGRLAAGALADLVWWDDDLAPRCAWVGGTQAGQAGQAERAPAASPIANITQPS